MTCFASDSFFFGSKQTNIRPVGRGNPELPEKYEGNTFPTVVERTSGPSAHFKRYSRGRPKSCGRRTQAAELFAFLSSAECLCEQQEV